MYFNGARLVHGNMSGTRGDDALPGLQQRADDGLVRLGAARQKKDFGFRRPADRSDLRGCRSTVDIRAVARSLFKIGGDEPFENLGRRAFHVVGEEIKLSHG